MLNCTPVLRRNAVADATKNPRNRSGVVELVGVKPSSSAPGATSHDAAPPPPHPQRLPCEQVDELVKDAAMMIKCENESGKFDEVR